MNSRHIIILICLLFIGSETSAQVPDLSSMTLNFRDATSTNLNPTVAETLNNDKSVEFGDYDNDGDLDVLIGSVNSSFGQRLNKLYRNDAGILNEVSGVPTIPGFSLTDTTRRAFFTDADNDGWLDILVVNDAVNGTSTITSPGRTKLFRNIDGATFVNVTGMLDSPSGTANSAIVADLDANGFEDLVLANHPNQSQDSISFNNINGNGPGFFQELTSTHLPGDVGYAAHVEAADMNGDGQVDLLVGNHTGDISLIHYNNNNDAGSGIGDFDYADPGAFSEFSSGVGSLREVVLVPADFNQDGLQDFYFANSGEFGLLSDAIFVNQGNDSTNRAQFLPVQVTSSLDDETMKVTIADLDSDGRDDVIVMSETRRPFLLRNTSENGEVSFLEWTPEIINDIHSGWGAAGDNLLGDESTDIVIGANNDDFLFEHISTPAFLAEDLPNGELPDFHGAAGPVLIVAEVEAGEPLVLTTDQVPVGAKVSVLLRSLGDASVAVSGDQLQLASDREGFGSDEFLCFENTDNSFSIQIELNGVSFDGNGDGVVDLLDIQPFIDCLTGASEDCDAFDTNDDGIVTLLDVNIFVDSLLVGGGTETVFLELLSRSN